MQAVDKNRDGYVDFQEFVTILKERDDGSMGHHLPLSEQLADVQPTCSARGKLWFMGCCSSRRAAQARHER